MEASLPPLEKSHKRQKRAEFLFANVTQAEHLGTSASGRETI